MMRVLRRYLGWAALPNITLWIIGFQVITYLYLLAPGGRGQPEMLQLLPDRVLAGEWWRVFSFVVLPPNTNLIFAAFFWWIFYLMGTSLEVYWGTFQYNLYLWIWWMASVSVALLMGYSVSQNYYLEQSVFLAFAWLNPEFTLMLFFILPVKIKWLAWLNWLFILFSVVFGDWGIRVSTLASVANFLIFFAPELRERFLFGTRRMKREAARIGTREPDYFHKCIQCGITDRSHPDADFRYCSQCAGQPCYCSEHLRTHEHIVETESPPDEADEPASG